MCVWLAFQRDFLFCYITIACMDHMIYQGWGLPKTSNSDATLNYKMLGAP